MPSGTRNAHEDNILRGRDVRATTTTSTASRDALAGIRSPTHKATESRRTRDGDRGGESPDRDRKGGYWHHGQQFMFHHYTRSGKSYAERFHKLSSCVKTVRLRYTAARHNSRNICHRPMATSSEAHRRRHRCSSQDRKQTTQIVPRGRSWQAPRSA